MLMIVDTAGTVTRQQIDISGFEGREISGCISDERTGRAVMRGHASFHKDRGYLLTREDDVLKVYEVCSVGQACSNPRKTPARAGARI
jgi:hypothetical protein